ncbi:hypothetical protein FOZ63_025346 [Perkinsus olseni]|uniref:Uncharacterized protein n=1 Tax=Perkinsus olseni TaxID=32597 RepID=A0A7J6QLB1_PEROL|nr:hypothetical protein FOZ62_024426 [Perkinsus olseni]KAF4759084.1 hypothetical protein FOZ63_025346 [Perkinsus olseni]
MNYLLCLACTILTFTDTNTTVDAAPNEGSNLRSAVLLIEILLAAAEDAFIGYEGGVYFHALINAEESSPNTPTFVYLPGGPGVSALGATLNRIGPCIVEADDFTLSLNDFSWARTANGIFIDAPGKTGFSVGPTETSMREYVDNLYKTLLEVISKAPHLRENLHLVGTSFDGQTLIARDGSVLLGQNPSVDSGLYRGGVEMARNRKLLPEKTIAKMVTDGRTCFKKVKACQPTGSHPDPDPSACQEAADFCFASLLGPLLAASISQYDVRTAPGLEHKYYKLITGSPEIHMNDKTVQAAMGVSKQWFSSDRQVFEDFHKFVAYDTTKVVSSLLDQGLKVVVFNGDQDFVTNSLGALFWLGGLKGTVDYGEQIAAAKDTPLKFKKGGSLGTIRAVKYTTGGYLAFINVSDGSHRLVLNKPLEMQQAIEAVLSGAIGA